MHLHGLHLACLRPVLPTTQVFTSCTTTGPALERPSDLVGILTNLSRGDVLFIDEIHRLPRIVEEYLYSAMEDFRIDFVVDSGPYAKSIPLHLEPFTLVGATTRAGLLTGPMRERFGIFHHIDFYTPEQLEKIAARAAGGELVGGGTGAVACGYSREG